MAYRDNVTALAARHNISNDPGLQEEDIPVQDMYFVLKSGKGLEIEGTDMNRGGRLFLMHQALDQGGGSDRLLIINEYVLDQARQYFAELWEDDTVPGKRPLLDALRNSVQVELFYKD